MHAGMNAGRAIIDQLQTEIPVELLGWWTVTQHGQDALCQLLLTHLQ